MALVQCMYITYCTCIRLKPVLSELLSTGHRWAPIHVRHKKNLKRYLGTVSIYLYSIAISVLIDTHYEQKSCGILNFMPISATSPSFHAHLCNTPFIPCPPLHQPFISCPPLQQALHSMPSLQQALHFMPTSTTGLPCFSIETWHGWTGSLDSITGQCVYRSWPWLGTH